MTETEYIKRTQPIVDFLCRIFDGYVMLSAGIQVAQANKDTQYLIDGLEKVQGLCESWIKELERLKDETD